MPTKRQKNAAAAAYRRAAVKLFGANKAEAQAYIVPAHEDTGGWAPEGLAVIYLEPDFRFPEDTGKIPDSLSYYARGGKGLENCFALSAAAGLGMIEYQNAAVAVVYEA